MKKILYISFLFITALALVQCSEDDNNNIIDPEATCEDGIQNGDEDGIDCGGSNCLPCEQGPEGIDFSGTYAQEDQVGRPAVSIVFVTEGFRDDFNTTIPSEMNALFTDDMLMNLESLNPDYTTNGGNVLGQGATDFISMLSNDVLWVAQNGSTTFFDGTTTLTGRKLGDDVMDFHLMLIFGGPDINTPFNDGSGEQPLLISDGVSENDKPFLESFPYLAAPF
ncbi:DUF4331 family protein [uncultured Planktosalinus sp.]|uniref:DUF4331 family protein n=1 Tax=uncultured Planktosalinus sp. TaxID=1810935 RepID=UPI0030D7F164